MSLLIFARCLCLEMVVMYTPGSPTNKFAIKNTSYITPNVQLQVFVHRRSAFSHISGAVLQQKQENRKTVGWNEKQKMAMEERDWSRRHIDRGL